MARRRKPTIRETPSLVLIDSVQTSRYTLSLQYTRFTSFDFVPYSLSPFPPVMSDSSGRQRDVMRTSGRGLRQADEAMELGLRRHAPVFSVDRVSSRMVLPSSRPMSWGDLLGDWSKELEIEWDQTRAIEIARQFPLLTSSFVGWRTKEFLTLATEPSASVDQVASRYPQARFFVGSLTTFARLTAGRFDWASFIDPPERFTWERLADLARLLRKRGCLFLRAPESDSHQWSVASARHERCQLRIVGNRPLGDGTELIVSRRK